MEGKVVQAYGGFYHVQVNKRRYECQVRGRIKQEIDRIAVGDNVEISMEPTGTWVIEKIYKRKNKIHRPLIANVDQIVNTFAAASPDPAFSLIDKFLVTSEMLGFKSIICINKMDLAPERFEEKMREVYLPSGYQLAFTSTKTGQGFPDLEKVLKGRVSVFIGPSGVGKSAIINHLIPGIELEEGKISKKIRRGKHTTKYISLFSIEDDTTTFIADTPGLMTIDIKEIDKSELVFFFPEISRLSGECKFRDCYHLSEPGCVIRDDLVGRQISNERYESYIKFLKEIEEYERRFKKW